MARLLVKLYLVTLKCKLLQS